MDHAMAQALTSRTTAGEELYFRILDDMAKLTTIRLEKRCKCNAPVDMTGVTADNLCVPCHEKREAYNNWSTERSVLKAEKKAKKKAAKQAAAETEAAAAEAFASDVIALLFPESREEKGSPEKELLQEYLAYMEDCSVRV